MRRTTGNSAALPGFTCQISTAHVHRTPEILRDVGFHRKREAFVGEDEHSNHLLFTQRITFCYVVWHIPSTPRGLNLKKRVRWSRTFFCCAPLHCCAIITAFHRCGIITAFHCCGIVIPWLLSRTKACSALIMSTKQKRYFTICSRTYRYGTEGLVRTRAT